MKLIPATSDISHYKVAEKLLESGVTMVHILRGRPGVVLPESLNTSVVRLNFSYRYGISDFCVDEKGIRASLSFKGVPQFCDVPWTAVCAISSQVTDDMFIWIDAFDEKDLSQFLPAEMVAQFAELKGMSILDEMPELKEFAKDEDEDSDDEDDEDDDDKVEYTPLRFV